MKNKNNFYLLVSGDISFKGNKEGFSDAKLFFENIIKKAKLKKKNFLVCPGNHDISSGSFSNFSKFSYALRKDNKFSFKEENSSIYFNNDKCFLAINTSYHLEHKFGKIDIDGLANLLKKNKQRIKESNTKIIFLHHHILNILDDDNSAIKNAYNFFYMIEKHGFKFIFHGHQHARQLFDINNIKINSISSLLEARTESNLVALYNITNEKIDKKDEFVFLKDEIKENGKRGRYKKVC